MSVKNNSTNRDCSSKLPCPVDSITQVPLICETVMDAGNIVDNVKIPVLLTEVKTQICTEADIKLDPPASEIKRVRKDIFLTQCKFVPVEFDDQKSSQVTKAKLFIEGFIRKNIEYATDECDGFIRDKIVDVKFSGCCELDEFDAYPILQNASENVARFITEDGMSPRQDKYFFENSVSYNEQPFCEIVSSNCFEVDFSPCPVDPNGTFDRLREKIVINLTLKVLQTLPVALGPKYFANRISVDDPYNANDPDVVALSPNAPTVVLSVDVPVKQPQKTQVSLDSMAQIAVVALANTAGGFTFKVTYEILRNGIIIATIDDEMDNDRPARESFRHMNFPNFPLVDNDPICGINTYDLRCTFVATSSSNIDDIFVGSRSLKATVVPC